METFTITRQLIEADLPDIPEEKLAELRAKIAKKLDDDFLRICGARKSEWQGDTTYPPKPVPRPKGLLGMFSYCAT